MIKAESVQLPKGCEVILHSPIGSKVYGTNVDDQADRDEMAIAIEPPELVVGLSSWETSVYRTAPQGVRSQPDDLDFTTHSLRKFARLAAKGNPSILLLLFAPPISADWQGRELLYHRDMFISREAGKCFMGYMKAQRMRMSGESGGRHGKPRTELIEKYGFDTKYAGHIIRLGYQGIELMKTGRMSLPMRQEEREDVLAIRNGLVTQQYVLDLAESMEQELLTLSQTSHLPAECDQKAISQFVSRLYLETWGQQGLLR